MAIAKQGGGRSPHGERGLKLKNNGEYDVMTGRSPHGERGLKYTLVHTVQTPDMSLSSWRAWIEIRRSARSSTASPSFSSWRAWIEIAGSSAFAPYKGSFSSWRAWIEMIRLR
ncbi:hypothetical protein BIFPSEUDO_03109 [Bifidobacterium pseudocatenulatum DSM 20438 = JCM 1200 = LMG 10505]|uniref:Uncharacterized protein n=1 Tax=Bifidobacterium pseudocatenulatum DSM 20438 = JCM 1200 = LMG 10505 TaxID=547043 RepID=C0BSJ0_BIFPS|nr:hypothetical protein BIFPSEUDO_03109 [Bifidobacterium pseudocatenulatum DSM 20438 = JCM 1200 = LMG 10505]